MSKAILPIVGGWRWLSVRLINSFLEAIAYADVGVSDFCLLAKFGKVFGIADTYIILIVIQT